MPNDRAHEAAAHRDVQLRVASDPGCNDPQLARMSCTAGATRCSGTLIQQCQMQANGCTAWAPAAACPSGSCLVDGCTAIPVDDKLVAYWSFTEPGPAVLDRSGNANHGIAWGAAHVAGKVGAGYQTGPSQCVLFPLTSSLMMAGGAAVTEMAWVSAVGCPASDNGVIFSKDFGYEIGVECASTKAQTAVYTDQQPWLWNVASPLPLNAWHHVASTWDGATVRLYVNAQPIGSWPSAGKLRVTTAGVGIGCYHVPNDGKPDPAIGGYLSGTIDEVAVYSRALTPAELTSYYLSTK